MFLASNFLLTSSYSFDVGCIIGHKMQRKMNRQNYSTVSNTANWVKNVSGTLCHQWHSVQTESTWCLQMM